MKRISAWRWLLCVGVVALSVATLGTARAQEALTIVSWGGAYTKSQVEAYHKPFAVMTGVKILSEDYNGGLAQIKAQVDSGNVTWSLVDVELSDALRGCEEGILERIPTSILPPAPDGTHAEQDFLPSMLQECGVGTIVWSMVFAFNGEVLKGDKPTTLKDFFDMKKSPG